MSWLKRFSRKERLEDRAKKIQTEKSIAISSGEALRMQAIQREHAEWLARLEREERERIRLERLERRLAEEQARINQMQAQMGVPQILVWDGNRDNWMGVQQFQQQQAIQQWGGVQVQQVPPWQLQGVDVGAVAPVDNNGWQQRNGFNVAFVVESVDSAPKKRTLPKRNLPEWW